VLGSPEGQQAGESPSRRLDLLILDNLSTLLPNGSEGASDAWLPMQNWFLRLRRKGVAVLLVHHAGVNGRQRGTSRREDALDTVIALRRPADYSPEQGARFEVHLEKARSMVGEGASPFEAAVESLTTERGSTIRWLARDLKPSVFEQAAALFQEGKSVRQVKILLDTVKLAAFALGRPPRGLERRPSVPNPRSRHLGTPKATGAACDEARCHVFALLDAKSSTS
jgi:putative DNA primase/helicase